VHLVVDRGVSVAQAARYLDLYPTVLRRWVQQYRDSTETAFPGKGQLAPTDDEVWRLRGEVVRLKAERDI
jgi:transposase